LQTVPGKGWNTIFRINGALEPWFDKTWKPRRNRAGEVNDGPKRHDQSRYVIFLGLPFHDPFTPFREADCWLGQLLSVGTVRKVYCDCHSICMKVKTKRATVEKLIELLHGFDASTEIFLDELPTPQKYQILAMALKVQGHYDDFEEAYEESMRKVSAQDLTSVV
jgi:hypothetical protein